MIECEEKVSVLLGTYNHKDYIGRALNSILMQKTDFDFTLWIADDCSTDGTSEIIKDIIKGNQNNRATIRHIMPKRNLGVKNKVLHFDNLITDKALHNQYVALCGGDDYWINDKKLQEQYAILRRHPDSISVCDSFIWGEPDAMSIYQHQSKIIQKNKAVYDPRNPYSQGSSIMFKNILDWDYFPDFCHDDGGFIKIFNFYGDNIFRDITTSVYDRTSQGLSVTAFQDNNLGQQVNYIIYLLIRIIHYLKTNENLLLEKDHNYIMTQLNEDWKGNDRYFMDDKILSFVEQYKNKRNNQNIPHYKGMIYETPQQYKILL